MILKVNDISIDIPVDNIDKGTEKFVNIMLSIIDKSFDNPSNQLNYLSLLHCGVPFTELMEEKNFNGEEFVKLISNISYKFVNDDDPSQPTYIDDVLKQIGGGDVSI